MPTNTPATITGWRVAALRERVYPALVPAEGTANGQLLIGLSPAEWRTLDAFEDDLYDLRNVTTDDGQQAWAYVTDHDEAVLPDDWDAEAFANHALAAYVERCRRWRQRHERETE